jgi:hypothetical protein
MYTVFEVSNQLGEKECNKLRYSELGTHRFTNLLGGAHERQTVS